MYMGLKNVRKKKYTAELLLSEPSSSEVELGSDKLKRYKSLGVVTFWQN
jgi:hypothetical protein